MKEPKLSIEIERIVYQHMTEIHNGLSLVSKYRLAQAGDILVEAIKNRKNIFTIGNGASASIAQHWACDYTKGCSDLENNFKPRVISLAANIPLMTAISNDVSYNEVYSYQLERLAERNDILIAISSSGSSPNIVRAIEVANKMGVTVIALTGFTGGQCSVLADISLYVPIHEYEAAEDVHQAIMHMLAKYVRTKNSSVQISKSGLV